MCERLLRDEFVSSSICHVLVQTALVTHRHRSRLNMMLPKMKAESTKNVCLQSFSSETRQKHFVIGKDSHVHIVQGIGWNGRVCDRDCYKCDDSNHLIVLK